MAEYGTKMTLKSRYGKDDSGAIYGDWDVDTSTSDVERSDTAKMNYSSFRGSVLMQFLLLKPPQLILLVS